MSSNECDNGESEVPEIIKPSTILSLRKKDENEWRELHEWCLKFRVENNLTVREFFILCGKPERPSFPKLLSKGGAEQNPSSKPSSVGGELRDILKHAIKTLPPKIDSPPKECLSLHDKFAIVEERCQVANIPVSIGKKVQTNQPTVFSHSPLKDEDKAKVSQSLKNMCIYEEPEFSHDVAISTPPDGYSFATNHIDKIGALSTSILEASSKKSDVEGIVRMNGVVSGFKSGTVIEHYGDSFVVSNFALRGDSGALVVDDKNNAVGIVSMVLGDNSKTKVVRITSIAPWLEEIMEHKSDQIEPAEKDVKVEVMHSKL
ncbi:hypothetical protein PPL_11081 [Heterostelium album PN500]|uniref:Uncharacterized protein n=1 Tax=Heterostelium pallidum (strain ATCC 26659 / Pp 5 / PN500) TaxID=670386 RepID=D3BSW1_HETP5|nr:hypothetical protein PPL_11081 [Heterostelium album PN500]EFA75576.1 hypothetical protein PPL_11081 [Heterostelium album PN500]|eukprot:XP_020427710.1 hypothetical protein PPL_11081 [Heterostelium album PN500]